MDPMLLDSMIEDIAILKKLGLTPLLIHGGGLGIKKKLDELNIESKFIMGLRVTDEKMIKIVEDVMVEFNKKIIRLLEKKSCKAKPITIKENNVIHVERESKELGYVGKPTKVNSKLLNDIIEKVIAGSTSSILLYIFDGIIFLINSASFHNNVATAPVIIEETAPALVAPFQNRAATRLGVIEAP